MQERLAIVETNINHIRGDVSEIKSMLVDHINKDSEKLTREEAYKAFAFKTLEPEVIRIRGTLNKAFWWSLGITGTLITGLIFFILQHTTA